MADKAGAGAVRNVIGVVIAVIVVVMLAVLVRIVFEFFGPLQQGDLYRQLVVWTDRLLLPVTVAGFKTPYAGEFNVQATLSLVAYLFLEYVLTALRRRF